MPEEPTTADGYRPEFTELLRSTALYVATVLGDLMEELVIVGGLVPSLIIAPREDAGVEPHVGTMDLDVGLTLALLDHERYRQVSDRLRRAGFSPDHNEQGNPTRQRWRVQNNRASVTVDFLIPPSRPDDVGGRVSTAGTEAPPR